MHEARLRAPRTEAELPALISQRELIARGNGRAYGDSAVSRGNTVHMRNFNRLMAFDPENGVLTAEAGVLLADVITAVPAARLVPAVTPGTKFVTLGGMIAADVHGKNHHRDGSFGSFVDWIDVIGARRPDPPLLASGEPGALRMDDRWHGPDRRHPPGRLPSAPSRDRLDPADDTRGEQP